jgi:hypothetical protein
MARPKELSDEMIAATRARLLREWDPTKRDPSAAEMSRRISEKVRAAGGRGLTDQALSHILAGRAGEQVVRTLEAYFGESREQWLREAQVEAAQPEALERIVVREERYPTVARAFKVARSTGVVSEDVLDIVRDEIGLHKGDGPTEEEVMVAIREALRRRDRSKAFLLGESEDLEWKPNLKKGRK